MASNTLLLKTESICWLWDSCGHNSISGMLLCLWTAQHYDNWLSWLILSSSLCCHCRLSLQDRSDICLQSKSFIGKKNAQENWIIHKKSFQKYAGWISEMSLLPKIKILFLSAKQNVFLEMFLQCLMGGDSLVLHGPFLLCQQSL